MANNQIRIMRHGVPTYVADWYKTLSPEAKKMIGQDNLRDTYPSGSYARAKWHQEQQRKYTEAMEAMRAFKATMAE